LGANFNGNLNMGFSEVTAVLALIVSGLAVAFARGAHKAARKFAQSQAIAQYMEEYATPDIDSALVLMGDWETNYSEGVRQSWLTDDMEEAKSCWKAIEKEYNQEAVHIPRRRLHWFYKRAYQGYKNGHLTKGGFEAITHTTGYRLFFSVVWPLTKLIHNVNA
jgi:hypothetical protein